MKNRIMRIALFSLLLYMAVYAADASAATFVGRVSRWSLPPGVDACELILSDMSPCMKYLRAEIAIVKRVQTRELVVKKFMTDRAGRFRVDVPSGVYSFRLVNRGGLVRIPFSDNISIKGNKVRYIPLVLSN